MDTNTPRNSLWHVKSGDKVGRFINNFSRSYWTEGTVDRTTDTLIIIDGKRFRRQDGTEYGAKGFRTELILPLESTFGSKTVEQWIDEDKPALLRRKRQSVITNTRFDKLSDEQINAIYSIITEKEPDHDTD